MQHRVQFRKIFGFRDRRKKVSLGIAHVAFDTAFLMSLRGRAVVALEQVMTAKGTEIPLLQAMVSSITRNTAVFRLSYVIRRGTPPKK